METPLVAFYAAGLHEAGRLERPNSRLEFLRTQELLRARLPSPPARVLDVGGGTGAHARWLAQDGYDVTLIDLVPAHVEQAAHHVDARTGDARALDIATKSIDVCLLLGPLYHLPEREDRRQALQEAARVTNGLVCTAAISRFAWPLYALRDGGTFDEDAIARTLASGRGDPVGALPDAYSHTPGELAVELAEAGLADIEIVGIEGPGWPQFTKDADAERLLDATLRTARLCDGHPELTAASAHLLGCGRATLTP